MGRLDADTEGLLLLTNDGDLANRIAHPSHGVEKEYLAQVDGGTVSPGGIRVLRDGVELEDGVTAPARVSQPQPGTLRLTPLPAAKFCGGHTFFVQQSGRPGECFNVHVTFTEGGIHGDTSRGVAR